MNFLKELKTKPEIQRQAFFVRANQIVETERKMEAESPNDYHNLRCEIAAEMLDTSAWLLDCKLVAKLNEVHRLVNCVGEGKLCSRQIIALIIADFQEKQNAKNKTTN